MRIAGRVVTPDGVVPDGYVQIDGAQVIRVGRTKKVHDGHWIVPGFVDIHVHGGGGHTFTTGDATAARLAVDFHRRHGTTTMLASLVSSPYDLMVDATEAFAPLVTEGVLAGIHFEGPYLSLARCGAQNPRYLRDPSLDELATLVDLGRGAVRMVTLAPERDGALQAIKLLREHDVVAAIGHTDATYEQTLAAVAAGATVGTHLFNGMPPPHHREPGPVFALLGALEVVCELVADGFHLHEGTLAFAAGLAGPRRVALVTDAVAAAGMPDGDYELGGQLVQVAGNAVRLARNGAIAGSTLTMAEALRRTVHAGVSMVDAVRMAATTPARAIGLGDTAGSLRPELRADLVVLDEQLRVLRVMRAGVWL